MTADKPLNAGSRYVLVDGGDGDQAWFSAPIHLECVERNWFPRSIPDFGEALLFIVDGGGHSGEYLALSGRGESLSASLATSGYAGIVAFRIANPDASYDARRDLEGLGRSVVYTLEFWTLKGR